MGRPITPTSMTPHSLGRGRVDVRTRKQRRD
jgi:hypothetical protein